jgi:hypothetical protein
MIIVETVKAMKRKPDSVLTLLLNTLFSQTGEEFLSLEPISDREFYSGITLVGAAILAFGLVVRIIGA